MVKQLTLGEMVDGLQELRAKKRALEAQIKAIEGEFDEMETILRAKMDEQKLDQVRGAKATASISERQVGRIMDDSKFFAYLTRTKNYFLFERRISSVALRDTLAANKNKPIPGIELITKRDISLRDL